MHLDAPPVNNSGHCETVDTFQVWPKLDQVWSDLPPAHRTLLTEYVARLQSTTISAVGKWPETSLNSEANFVQTFENGLLAHAVSVATVLEKKEFEQVYAAAVQACGKKVVPVTSTTTAYRDLVEDGVGVALKTQQDKKLNPERVWISKLSEAAWIGQCPARYVGKDYATWLAKANRAYLGRYLKAVQRMLVLRRYQSSEGVCYELVEIPMSIFSSVLRTPSSKYSTCRGTTLHVPLRGAKILTYTLDYSDGKVSLSLPISACTVHARWLVCSPNFKLTSSMPVEQFTP